MTTLKHTLPPEVEKIRDENATNLSLESHPVVWVENKLTGFKTDPNYPSRKFKEENYKAGFNEGYHTAIEEMAGKVIELNCDCTVAERLSGHKSECAVQQTSLIYEAKIAKLEAELELQTEGAIYHGNECFKSEAKLTKATEALKNAEKYLTSCGYDKAEKGDPDRQMLEDFRKTLAEIGELK